MVLEKTLESPKETQPIHPKGDQSWVFIGGTDVKAETPILWPPDAKSWLIWKDPDAGKDWGQEEKGTTVKEIQQVHPNGDQSWVFIGGTDVKAETPILWPPDAESWLIGKDPDAGKGWRWEEKEVTEDEMVGWCHRLDKHEFE